MIPVEAVVVGTEHGREVGAGAVVNCPEEGALPSGGAFGTGAIAADWAGLGRVGSLIA